MGRAGDSNFGSSRFGVFAAKDFRVRNGQPPASKTSPVIPILQIRCPPPKPQGASSGFFAACSPLQW